MKITCISAQGSRTTADRAALLTPTLRETARAETARWIKSLRLVRYGSVSMRERFTYHDDSLWWFTELYLHKMRRLEAAVETVLALTAARESGAAAFEIEARDYASRAAARAFGEAHGVRVELGAEPALPGHRWPSAAVGWTARLSRLRAARVARPAARPAVAAFVHTAFWREADPQRETYIGPVLDALIARTNTRGVSFVGLGPRRNFRARRWWDPVASNATAELPVTSIERFAPADAISGALQLWRQRRELAEELTRGTDIRAAAEFRACDLWPVLEHELQGAALVQWPWSARSMDEAAAAIETLEPGAVMTYAEAGGWGRALVLEARRRGVPSFGVQHGFIYRHWLNYLHEPDEMCASGRDRGFPRPDRTLLYDRVALEHLETAGHFPPDSLIVTGSSRLEDLMRRAGDGRARREEIRQRLGLHEPSTRLALLTAKFTEISPELPALVDAVSSASGLTLAIKPHPAETPDVYTAAASGRPHVLVTPPSIELAELLAAADVLVTKNSTVAIDSLVLGLPAVVIGLPNNLSPFVDAGVMVGAEGAEKIQQAMQSVLYDPQVRQRLAARAREFVARYEIAPTPGAADRAAEAILSLTRNSA